MTRTQIYRNLKSRKITLEDAAQQLQIDQKDLEYKIAHYGKRLPSIFQALDKIENDIISRSEASVMMDVAPRQVNQIMLAFSVRRPLAPYLLNRAEAKLKWDIRKKYAIDYIGGGLDLFETADKAGVGDRQLRRWVAELLIKHFEMTYFELRKLSLRKRRSLADEIEIAEGLEMTKQKAIEEVENGNKTLRGLALEQVMRKRNRGFKNVRRRAE